MTETEKKEVKKGMRKRVKAHYKELSADSAKLEASIERIRNLPDKQKKMAQKAIKKLPKSMRDAAKKLFGEDS